MIIMKEKSEKCMNYFLTVTIPKYQQIKRHNKLKMI